MVPEGYEFLHKRFPLDGIIFKALLLFDGKGVRALGACREMSL